MSISNSSNADSGTKLTYDDYVLIPVDGWQHEIIDGRHRMNPAPVPYHQHLVTRILVQLFSEVEQPGLGKVFPAPIDIQLSEHDVVQPDLVVVLSENAIITRFTRPGGGNPFSVDSAK